MARLAVRALLVDLGNVLVRFDHFRTARRLADASGADPSRLLDALHGPEGTEYDRGAISRAEFFRSVERRARIRRIPDTTWIPAWRDIFEAVPEAIAAVALARRAVRVALVSNTNELHWEGVQLVADLEPCVDSLVLSFRVGSLKPEREIFEAALSAVGAAPGEALFADDRPDFVEAAAALGINGFVIDSSSALTEGLARAGLFFPPARDASRKRGHLVDVDGGRS